MAETEALRTIQLKNRFKVDWFYNQMVIEGGISPVVAEVVVQVYKEFNKENSRLTGSKHYKTVMGAVIYRFFLYASQSKLPSGIEPVFPMSQEKTIELIETSIPVIRALLKDKTFTDAVDPIIKAHLITIGFVIVDKPVVFKRFVKKPLPTKDIINNMIESKHTVDLIFRVIDDLNYQKIKMPGESREVVKIRKEAGEGVFILPWRAAFEIYVALMVLAFKRETATKTLEELSLSPYQFTYLSTKKRFTLTIIDRIGLRMEFSDDLTTEFKDFYNNKPFEFTKVVVPCSF